MVHALEIVHSCLDPDAGLLIDIRPLPTPQRLSVRVDSQSSVAGTLVESADTLATYWAADRALDGLVQSAHLFPTGQSEFILLVHLDTIDDLREFWYEDTRNDDDVNDKQLDREVVARAEALLLLPGVEREMVLEVPARIAAFRRG